MREVIKNVPIPAAGVALGLAALGNLLQPYAGAVYSLCGLLAACVAALVAAKAILFPEMVAQDFKNPLLASVSATFWMAGMQLSTYIASLAFIPAACLWAACVVAHLGLICWFTARHARQVTLDQVFPTYFICYVGIIVASVTSPVFGMESLGSVLFWFGFACYPVLLVVVTARYVCCPPPDAARPLFCIYSAPASLSLVGYLAIAPQPNITFVAIMLMCAQAFFVVALARVPRFVSLGFYPSFAAMTFPFVITATALGQALAALNASGVPFSPVFDMLVLIETAFAVAMVVFVVIRYAVFLTAPLRERGQSDAMVEIEGNAA